MVLRRPAGDRPAGFKQPVGLLGIDDVAREKNDSGRLQPPQQGTESRLHLDAIEADDQKLSQPLDQKALRVFSAGLDLFFQLRQQVQRFERRQPV